MTEGIIDKVFEKWHEESIKRHYPFDTCDFPIQTELEQLKQELKAEIEKACKHHCGDNNVTNNKNDFCFEYVVIDELIGNGEKKE